MSQDLVAGCDGCTSRLATWSKLPLKKNDIYIFFSTLNTSTSEVEKEILPYTNFLRERTTKSIEVNTQWVKVDVRPLNSEVKEQCSPKRKKSSENLFPIWTKHQKDVGNGTAKVTRGPIGKPNSS